VCAEHGAAVVPQGGNTGLVGASVPRHNEVVLSLTRLAEIGEVDAPVGQVTAGAGATLAALQAAARAADQDAALDFGARDSCTVGGVVACDAGGARALRHGTARGRVGGLRTKIGAMSARREATRTFLEERVQRVEDALADIEARSSGIRSLRDIESLQKRLANAQSELNKIDLLSTEPVPLPTMDEQVHSDRYAVGLERLRRALESGNSADIGAARENLNDIESLAGRRRGEEGPLGRLWDHIETLTETRRALENAAAERNFVHPIEEPPKSGTFVEGMGRKFNTESARFGPFRGRTYSQVEAELGRPPDKIDGAPPGRVRPGRTSRG